MNSVHNHTKRVIRRITMVDVTKADLSTSLHAQSIQDPISFWQDAAKMISWVKAPTQISISSSLPAIVFKSVDF